VAVLSEEGPVKKSKQMIYPAATAVSSVLVLTFALIPATVSAHKVPHDKETLKAFHDAFMEQVVLGDRLYHGDADAQKQLGVTLSRTGMACAMCHPIGSDIHPHEFPKFQEQMSEFATLRNMINWCIEKPNEGEKIDPNGDAMKALETYMYWSARGSVLDPGRH
jgi:thiosulfate dehydrogenase